jgi:small-conductance mechanosensitive channel
MNNLIEWLRNLFQGGLSDMQIKVFLSIFIFFLQWVFKRILTRSISKIQISTTARYNWRKAISYVSSGFAFLGIAFLWSNQFSSFATFLGLLSAGLAIAFKDPIVNMAGWYYIVFRKPFKVGDRVQVDSHIGDVIDVNQFEFMLIEVGNWVDGDQSTGRILHIPNMRVFSSVIANYNALVDYIWDEVEVNITFESNWRKAKGLLQEILVEHAPQIYDQAEKDLNALSGAYFIQNTKLTPVVYTSVSDYGIKLYLRYLCKPNKRRVSNEEIWEAILDCFMQEDDIEFAYPTRRIVNTAPHINSPLHRGGNGEAQMPPMSDGD